VDRDHWVQAQFRESYSQGAEKEPFAVCVLPSAAAAERCGAVL